jgi:hypothetical protein
VTEIAESLEIALHAHADFLHGINVSCMLEEVQLRQQGIWGIWSGPAGEPPSSS